MVDERTAGRLRALQAAWTRSWPRAWADPDRRAAMIDLHAWLHAVSLVVDGRLAGTSCALPSVAELAGAVVRDALPALSGPDPVVPVMAGLGRPLLRAERSRPAWRVSGIAVDVPWIDGARSLVVLATDEGDNEIVAVVVVDASGVRVSRGEDGTTSVRLDDVTVPEQRLVHRPDARAALADRSTVLGLASAVAEAGAAAGGTPIELELCAAATHAAALTAFSPSARPMTRQHDVSAAAVVTLSTLARLRGGVEGDDLAWHRERLAPLI